MTTSQLLTKTTTLLNRFPHDTEVESDLTVVYSRIVRALNAQDRKTAHQHLDRARQYASEALILAGDSGTETQEGVAALEALVEGLEEVAA